VNDLKSSRPVIASSSRREFLKKSATVAASSALAGVAIAPVHAAEDNTIRVALIGCGGRGSGAAGNAMSAPGGPVKLHVMTDLFAARLNGSNKALKKGFGDQVDVPAERRLLGFDAYRQAIDSLRPGDVAMLTAYSYCRPAQLEYAVEKGINVFMEKPFAPDPAGLQRMLRASRMAEKKNLKIAAGLMCRHSVARQALIRKIRDGDLGDITLIRAYRMDGGSRLGKWPGTGSELQWQVRNRVHFHGFGSGLFIELLIHQIDECCWIKDAWPVAAQGLGGRTPMNLSYGQNLDTYAIEYTFADGTKATVDYRGIPKCRSDFATFLHGTKRAAQFSGNVHQPTVHTYSDQRTRKDNIDWRADKEPCGPHQAEWNVLLSKIRSDQPHNEIERAVYADFASIMGRAAVHCGKIVTWDDLMKSKFQFYQGVDQLTLDGPTPLPADAEGRYPIPIPGAWTEV
jgi:predicted dehydrogenase